MAARPRGMQQERRFALRLPDELYDEIERIAQAEADKRQEYVSTASVMRQLIREALDARRADEPLRDSCEGLPDDD